MRKNPRAVFAQSSDIKSRTFLQYRHDMKKKAIAELEVKEWLEETLSKQSRKKVTVEKSGGDAHVWFLRTGKISGDPDYKVWAGGECMEYEFQYSDSADLDFFDFKVSKIGKKAKGKRIPHKNRKFVYIIKPTLQYAVFDPAWVMQNGKVAGVPAWGNRTAYRVPRDIFAGIMSRDVHLRPIVDSINRKNDLLDFQAAFLEREERRLSAALQKTVDDDEAFSIIPKTLKGFYESCFLMNRMQKHPQNRNLWIVYLATYLSDNLNSLELSRFVFSLDYLYSSIEMLEQDELRTVAKSIAAVAKLLDRHHAENFRTSNDLSPREEIRNYLFSVNLYEDLVQDVILNYMKEERSRELPPVTKIFQTVKDIEKVHAEIRKK